MLLKNSKTEVVERPASST